MPKKRFCRHNTLLIYYDNFEVVGQTFFCTFKQIVIICCFAQKTI